MVRLMMFALLMVISFSPMAGEIYEGWGETPKEAMREALDTATEKSKGGCLCKGWSMKMTRDCSEGLGGYICKACGSNHKGSCLSGSEVERTLGDLKKIKGLFE